MVKVLCTVVSPSPFDGFQVDSNAFLTASVHGFAPGLLTGYSLDSC